MRMAEKSLLLQLLDQIWKDHLLSLDHLRQGIYLRAYGQRDPLNEYKREAFELFEEHADAPARAVTVVLSHIEVRLGPPPEEQQAAPPPPPPPQARMRESRPSPALALAGADAFAPPAKEDFGQGLPQRALPLRLGQEIQVLPRAGVAALRRLPPRLPPPDGRAPDIAVSAAVPRLKSGAC